MSCCNVVNLGSSNLLAVDGLPDRIQCDLIAAAVDHDLLTIGIGKVDRERIGNLRYRVLELLGVLYAHHRCDDVQFLELQPERIPRSAAIGILVAETAVLRAVRRVVVVEIKVQIVRYCKRRRVRKHHDCNGRSAYHAKFLMHECTVESVRKRVKDTGRGLQ